MKKEQDPRDADVLEETPAQPKEKGGASERDRSMEHDPPSGGGAGGNTTKSDI